MERDGSIVGVRTIVDHGPPDQRFDIVILGEGFTASALRRFDAKAQMLADALLRIRPFADVADLINVHTVRTISTESGVSRFVRPGDVRRTFYEVRGRFHVPGLAAEAPKSFLGTPRPEWVLAAAEEVAPLQHLELFVVLCNVNAFAASAFPEQNMAFTGLHQTDADLVDYAAHEIGHAIARLAEEYLDCDGPTPGVTYPNQVTEERRLSGDVWWKSLAAPDELDASGAFRAVHLHGDPGVHFTAGLQTPVFDRRPERNGKLGLYWGCQDIDPALPGSCEDFEDWYQDPRGRGYYRGMAACKMRVVKSPFCRVCAHLITEQIVGATQ